MVNFADPTEFYFSENISVYTFFLLLFVWSGCSKIYTTATNINMAYNNFDCDFCSAFEEIIIIFGIVVLFPLIFVLSPPAKHLQSQTECHQKNCVKIKTYNLSLPRIVIVHKKECRLNNYTFDLIKIIKSLSERKLLIVHYCE